MNYKEGDILQHGLIFYRIDKVFPKYLVVKKVLYNPKFKGLQISHVNEFVDFDEIGEGKYYNYLDAENPDTKIKLDWLKRKPKLEQLKKINDNDQN